MTRSLLAWTKSESYNFKRNPTVSKLVQTRTVGTQFPGDLVEKKHVQFKCDPDGKVCSETISTQMYRGFQ
ncbi:hypothetical protein PHMEG_00028106 [Phytophthora megakarya]|uniref:Uncharacterized protein n=1 Tax=Phytophthora megakarya TaxID=4795 RepID=A0A225V6Y9_9STRA|nr:hypothetical protein PHMEG_00028106 [Phytophthora megakarya]